MSAVPLIVRGFSLTALMAKSSKVTRLSFTGIFSGEKSNEEPSIVMSTAVESNCSQPLKTGSDILPVMSISPLSMPRRRAVPWGRNGLTTDSGKCIILKSSRKGLAAVESLRLPDAVMVFTPSTISDVVARMVPEALVERSRSRSKSPTFSRP